MKRWILTCFASLMAMMSFAHSYYFAFAEIEYKPTEKRIEATLTASIHEMEDVFKSKKLVKKHLEGMSHSKENLKKIEAELGADFYLVLNGEKVLLKLLDFECTLEGKINFYLYRDEIVLPKEASFLVFKTLMKAYENQQNKASLIIGDHRQTIVFLKNSEKQKINL
ncbi:MAG: hypothetical protein EP338_12055 [Bacteroidetes bacterium]|nr:MAG: hypothetical protein EP338_12055 [Bacteroidota bacterium]